LKTWAA